MCGGELWRLCVQAGEESSAEQQRRRQSEELVGSALHQRSDDVICETLSQFGHSVC